MRMSRKEFKQKYPDASITAWIRYRCTRREPVNESITASQQDYVEIKEL